MAMNGTALIAQTKRLLSESVPDLTNDKFPDANILAAINSAQVEVVRRSKHDWFRSESTVAAAVGDIAVPSTMLHDIYVQTIVSATDRRTLVPRTRQELDKECPNWRTTYATSLSDVWGFVVTNLATGLYIRLFPILQTAVANGLCFTGSTKPTDITDATSSALFPGTFFQEFERMLLPAGACRELLMYENGAKDSQVMKWDSVFDSLCNGYMQAINGMFVEMEGMRG